MALENGHHEYRSEHETKLRIICGENLVGFRLTISKYKAQYQKDHT